MIGESEIAQFEEVGAVTINIDTLPRKVMFIVFKPAGYTIDANMKSIEVREQYYRELRSHLREDRLGILEMN